MGKDGYVSIMEVPCFITVLKLELILCSRLRDVRGYYVQASVSGAFKISLH